VLKNLIKVLSICSLLLFCNNVQAEFKDWNKTDKILFGSYIGLNVVDIGQSFDIVHCQKVNPNCNIIERNPFLGPHPSKEKIILYKAAFMGVAYAGLKNTNPKTRRTTLLLVNAITLTGVVNNHKIGLRFNIRF